MAMIFKRLERYFQEARYPVLFAGAGVSTKAGLPSWWAYMQDISAQVGVYDGLTRQMMQRQLELKQYDSAAEYFFICNLIPEGRKYEMLIEPLKRHTPEALSSLISLPFRAIVTTNFDRALLDSYAMTRGCSAVQVELGDRTLQSAPFLDEVFVARIHGRVEDPKSIVLSTTQFRQLIEIPSYKNFLTHIATQAQICFLGFSFADPAINHVLQVVRDNIGPLHNGNHVAFLPQDAAPELSATLTALNIEVVRYDSADQHAALWAGIEQARTGIKIPLSDSAQAPRPFDYARKYLAAAYSRSRLGRTNVPLRLAVLEGVVAEELSDAGAPGLSESELTDIVHKKLHLSSPDARGIVQVALDRLHRDGKCDFISSLQRHYVWKGGPASGCEDPVSPLVDGVMDRFVVRSGGTDRPELRECVGLGLNKLFLRRGWDLGAAFASGRIPETLALDDLDRDLRSCNKLNPVIARRLLEAISDMLRSPTQDQSVVLAQVGRMSFGLELVFQSPQDTLFHALTLPEAIYLDANVLMPAIVNGHPYHETYRDTIARLHIACAEAMVQIEVLAYKGFLNEVISHRRLAMQEMEELGAPLAEQLRKDVLLFGSSNLNVFVGSYANMLRNDQSLTFNNFLARFAPYEDEASLEKFLEKMSIVVRREGELLGEGDTFPQILHHLEIAFADAIANKKKTPLTVRHDAVQLTGLFNDAKRGKRSILVTADGKLRDTVAQSKWSSLGNSMLSNIGLIQLIDLLVGVNVESRGLASMMFFPRVSSEAEMIRQYLVSRALDSYDDAMAMEMHRLVDQYAEDVDLELQKQGQDKPDFERRSCLRRVMDGFENRYFSEMKKLIEKAQETRAEQAAAGADAGVDYGHKEPGDRKKPARKVQGRGKRKKN